MAKETKQHRSWVEAPVVEAEILAAGLDGEARGRAVADADADAGGPGGTPYVPPRKPFRFGRWFGATGWRHIVGIVALVFTFFLGVLALPVPIVGLVLGFLGKSDVRRGATNRGMATAGIVLNIIAIVLAVILLAVGAAIFASNN